MRLEIKKMAKSGFPHRWFLVEGPNSLANTMDSQSAKAARNVREDIEVANGKEYQVGEGL